MLQSFVGTIDKHGLRTLTPEPDEISPGRGCRDTRLGAIWAVLDTSNLRQIQEALVNGERQQALRLLSNHAKSLGSLLD